MSSGWLSRIAEADAGLPDEDAAARVLAAGDPGTERVLEALAATRADLAALARPRMPREVAGALAAGFDAIDAGERPEPAPAVETPPVMARRGRRTPRRVLLLTAAAAALVAVVLTGPGREPTDLATAAGRVLAEQTKDVGTLDDPATLASCLVRAGAPAPVGPLLAGRPIRIDGIDGLLLVISTGKKGEVRAVVPDRSCTRVLADLVVGG